MDELDEKLQELASEYHAPGDVPRDRMWERIQASRGSRGRGRDNDSAPLGPRPTTLDLDRFRRRRVIQWGIGIAATLMLGVLIGRGTAPNGQPAQPVEVAASSGSANNNVAAINVAARAHLRQSEAYLTLFRASVREGDLNDLGVDAARQLLATNRLIMNAPGTDPRLKALLSDLELVLAEITQLQASERPEDIEMITDGLDRAGMLTRLRAATPANPGAPIPMGVS